MNLKAQKIGKGIQSALKAALRRNYLHWSTQPGQILIKWRLLMLDFDPRILTEGKVDIYPVYKSNEPFMIGKWGYDIDLWTAEEYGVPTLGLTYVTSDETLKNDPDMLARFLRAAIKGILYAEQNPEEAIDFVLKVCRSGNRPRKHALHAGYRIKRFAI